MEERFGKRYQGSPIHKNGIEHAAWQRGHYICGIDEVGRGCLAGPLVTAAVILPINKTSRLLQDSKILTEEERHKGAIWVAKNCWYSYGIVDHGIIDRYNIYQATLIAMKKALLHLLSTAPRPTAIVVDAMPLKIDNTEYFDIPVKYFPKGESWSSSIAAASIIAKVKRDSLMTQFDEIFPGFSLNEHKGYGTKKHAEALQYNKSLIIHRKSFLHNITTDGIIDEFEKQQNLFL